MTTLTDEQLYEQLKDLPDFDRFPLPKYWYEKFKIPPPKILSLMEAVKLSEKTYNAPGFNYQPMEVREPAPGGIREILADKPLEIEVKPGVSIEDAIETPVHQESQ
jgi:hypothetical protein